MADANGPTIPAGSASGRPGAPAPGGQPAVDTVALIRSRQYIVALVLAAVLGVPISAICYGFLALVTKVQELLFSELPMHLLGGAVPAWWPVPFLVLCGLLTGLTVRYLPGNGGHSPAFGFTAGGGPPTGAELVGITLAAFTTLALGAVLGPEAPLIAIGGGLAALTVRLAKKDAPPTALTIMSSAGSFAAISTLLGSPLLGAFLIMEAAGIGGAALSLVALPGLLASGLGALVFIGLGHWTGLGNFSISLTSVPPAVAPTLASLGWALVMGAAGALLTWSIRWIGLSLRPIVHLNRVLVTSSLGLLIGLTAMAYQLLSGRSFQQVLFSGQGALPELVEHAADYSLPVLVLLIVAKAFTYGLSLSAFRGGPVFPSMFIGAALGVAASGLPGMSLAAAIGMGIGAMSAAMLRLPMTATLLATLLMGVDGVAVTPQVVVAVAVAFVFTHVLPIPDRPSPLLPRSWTRSKPDEFSERARSQEHHNGQTDDRSFHVTTNWTTETKDLGEYAEVNGINLYFETHGAGRPMILLHGGLGSGEMFGPTLPALAEGHQVILVDLQGHGRTADIDRPIDIRLMADDIAALIDHLRLEKPDIVGYSLGGGVALFTAVKYPEKVGKLVCASAHVRRDAIPPEMLAQQAQVNAAAVPFMKDTPMYELYHRVAPHPDNFGRLLDKVGESMGKDFDFSEEVRGLQVPTLIVAADADMAPPSHYVEIFKLLDGGLRDGGWMGEGRPKGGHALAILPGLTHYNLAVSPLFVAVTLDFLDAQSGG